MKALPHWQHIRPTLNWLLRSIQTHQGNGSAAYYKPSKGWGPAYPETTGYLIETLLDYDRVFPELGLSAAVERCGQWFLDTQQADGSFLLNTEAPRPVIFDNGQILFGLLRLYQDQPNDAYQNAVLQLRTWLLQQLNAFTFRWQKNTYRPDYSPSYHTRVHWALALSLRYFPDPAAAKVIRQSLHAYAIDYQNNGSFTKWALIPGDSAWTHSIAYTYRGLLEAASLLKEPALQLLVDSALQKFAQQQRFAARYDADWKGDYDSICVTGHAQLISLFLSAYQKNAVPDYRTAAERLWQDIENAPAKVPWPGIRGGIPGSIPFRKGYKAGNYLNWAAKFYADAFWGLKRVEVT